MQSQVLVTWFFLGVLASASAIRLRNGTFNATAHASFRANSTQPPTFQAYYQTHAGRGMWKWATALDAYQVHMSPFVNRPCNLLEIGVQSGGSINMYHAVLPDCHYYGMDVNRNCVQFTDPATTIFIGDQASVPAWSHFFTNVASNLDIVIDDGGHQAHQMLTTIQQVLPHMSPGGFFFTEDIHGQNDDYLGKFFHPAAHQIAWHASQGRVTSVHLYPFMLGVQIAGGVEAPPPPAAAQVQSLEALVASLPQHLGAAVELRNPAWQPFSETALQQIFSTFYDMHGGHVREEPPECHDTMLSNCDMIATNTPQQNMVKAVRIYADSVRVETHATAPIIVAHRRGQTWIPYNGP